MNVLLFSEKLSFEESLFSRGVTTPFARAEEMGQAIGRKLLAEKIHTRVAILTSPSLWGNALLVAARLLEASGIHVVIGVILENKLNPPVWKSLFRLLRKRNIKDIFLLTTKQQWRRFFTACQGVSHLFCSPFTLWKTSISQQTFGEWAVSNIPKLIGLEVPFGWPHHCVPMQQTWSLDFPVAEILDYPIRRFAGEVVILSSFLPQDFVEEWKRSWFLSSEKEVKKLLRQRLPEGHKGTFGRTLIVGGSSFYPGALFIASQAALQSGCGLVTVAMEEPIPLFSHEVTYLPLPVDRELATLESYLQKLTTSSILVGNGWGENPRHKEWLRFFITQPYVKKLIIDADGLNLLAKNEDLFELLFHHQKYLVLTPHVGEMVRLLRVSSKLFQENRWQMTQELAHNLNAVIVQKDATTIIALPEGELWFSCYGNDALAKGGSGDILAGLVAGLMASGYDGKDASLVATFLLGKTAEIYTSYYPSESATPLKLLSFLSQAWRILSERECF